MGGTLNGCRNCTTTKSSSTHNDFFQISTYYSSRLAQFQEIQSNIPHYANVIHSRLANDLRLRGEKFVDMVQPYEHLINNPHIQWKRIPEVFPKQAFSARLKGRNFQFEYPNKMNGNSNRTLTVNLAKALMKLMSYPELIQKIFPNFQISKEGFYIVYFCLAGNIQKKIEIIVDDYIPVDSNGKYLFDEPREGEGIWMVVLQKAWAKIMTSYHHLEALSPEFFFSEMTGVPLQELYTSGDFLMSGKYQFQGGESKYLKICRDSPVPMVVCVWQAANPDFITNISPPDFIVQIICQTISPEAKEYSLLPAQSQKIGNKVITMHAQKRAMFPMPKGQNIIHIFNRSKSKKQCNVVIHSQKKIDAHTRYEKQFQEAKRIMIRNEYRKIHESINVQLEHPEVQLRFCWMGHRGIFCIKNKRGCKKRIQMSIKKMFQTEVYFQDNTDKVKNVELEEREYGFFVVVRSEDREYGPFYEIAVHRSG